MPLDLTHLLEQSMHLAAWHPILTMVACVWFSTEKGRSFPGVPTEKLTSLTMWLHSNLAAWYTTMRWGDTFETLKSACYDHNLHIN